MKVAPVPSTNSTKDELATECQQSIGGEVGDAIGGEIQYSAPQVAQRDEPLLEELAIEMQARGLLVRDIGNGFKDASGRLAADVLKIFSWKVPASLLDRAGAVADRNKNESSNALQS